MMPYADETAFVRGQKTKLILALGLIATVVLFKFTDNRALAALSFMLGVLVVLWWRFEATTGTKSVLFGAHCFFLHPWFVAWGWFQLYGTNRVVIGTRRGVVTVRGLPSYGAVPVTTTIFDPRLWLVFAVHDIGYIGKREMDDEEGEQHPRVGGAIMRRLFGEPWGEFTVFHSRFLAKRAGAQPSPLCFADKIALSAIPWWLYLPMVQFTGEAAGYSFHKRRDRATTKYNGDPFTAEEDRLASSDRMRDRVRAMQMYTRRWVAEHRDGRADTWTPTGVTS